MRRSMTQVVQLNSACFNMPLYSGAADWSLFQHASLYCGECCARIEQRQQQQQTQSHPLSRHLETCLSHSALMRCAQ